MAVWCELTFGLWYHSNRIVTIGRHTKRGVRESFVKAKQGRHGAKMDEDTVTWVSGARSHTWWLDHVEASESLLARLDNFEALHHTVGSDHTPLFFALSIQKIRHL